MRLLSCRNTAPGPGPRSWAPGASISTLLETLSLGPQSRPAESKLLPKEASSRVTGVLQFKFGAAWAAGNQGT